MTQLGYATAGSVNQNQGNNLRVGDTQTPDDNETPGTGDNETTDPEPVAPTLPSCSLSNVTYTAKPFTVTLGSTANKLEYALISIGSTPSQSDWRSVTGNTVEIDRTGTYYFYYRVTDESSSLTSSSNAYKIYYDTTAPRAPSIEESRVYKQSELRVDISVSEDSGSEIDEIYYRVDRGRWYEYDGYITIDREGTYEIEAYCVDKCGNESSVSRRTVELSYKRMMELPTVRMLDKSPSADTVRFKLSNYDTSIYDYKYKFVPKGSSSGNTDWTDCTGSTVMSISESGEWDLHILVSYDGSSKSGSVGTCIIDHESPQVLGVYSSVQNKNVSIEIDAKDKYSKKLQYSFDSGKTWSTNNKKNYNKSTSIDMETLRVKDECGNITRINYKASIDTSGNKATIDEYLLFQTKDNVEINKNAYVNGYLSGYGNGIFGPDNKMTRAEVAAVFNRIFKFSSSMRVPTYKDIAPHEWFYNNVCEVQKLKLFDTNNDEFKPRQFVTRAELAHAICQFMDLSRFGTSNNPYTDLYNYNSHYRDDVLRVTAAGIMGGYGNGIFGPEDTLTRAQVTVVINRLIGIENKIYPSVTFKDVPNTHWAYQEIVNATN